MTHYEVDRTPRSATRIDADLDSSVLTDADPPCTRCQTLTMRHSLPPTSQRTRTAAPFPGRWLGTTRAVSSLVPLTTLLVKLVQLTTLLVKL